MPRWNANQDCTWFGAFANVNTHSILVSDVFDILMTRDLSRGHILDFNPYAPRTDTLLFAYEELQSLLDAGTLKPIFRAIDSRSHPAAARNSPLHQHNMVPFDALDMSSGQAIESFAESWRQNILKSMHDDNL